jgi:surface protein
MNGSNNFFNNYIAITIYDFSSSINIYYQSTYDPTSHVNIGHYIDASNTISYWDVSQVADMSDAFYRDVSFNVDISNWNVGNVTDMSDMFNGCSQFNQPLNSWDVSNVTDMSGMFMGCTSFTNPLNSWVVENVTDMSGMFMGCSNFNRPLDLWNVSSVQTMNSMFTDCSVFTQDLLMWDVSSVQTMNSMFMNCSAFPYLLEIWDVSLSAQVIDMFTGAYGVGNIVAASGGTPDTNHFLGRPSLSSNANFANAITEYFGTSVTARNIGFHSDASFNRNKYVSYWDVSAVTNMSGAFQGRLTFNENIDMWDVSHVTDMTNMFNGCGAFDQPLNSWNVSSVTNMSSMFSGCISFNQPLNSWNVSTVENMSYMFYNDVSFNNSISDWVINTDKFDNMSYMFFGCIEFDLSTYSLSHWAPKSAIILDGAFALKSNESNTSTSENEVYVIDPSNNNYYIRIINSSGTPYYDNNTRNSVRYTLSNGIYNYDSTATTSNIQYFDIETAKLNAGSTATAIAITDSFNYANIIYSPSVATVSFDMAKACYFDNTRTFSAGTTEFVLNAHYIALISNISGWDVSAVTNMSGKFLSKTTFNANINQWDVSNVENMSSMFSGCSNFDQPLNSWNVSKVENMSAMFYNCSKFNRDLNSWNVSNVENMSQMFYNCREFNGAVAGWNVSDVRTVSRMFMYCVNFNKVLLWNSLANCSNFKQMFYGCTKFNFGFGPDGFNNSKLFALNTGYKDMNQMFKHCDSMFLLPVQAHWARFGGTDGYFTGSDMGQMFYTNSGKNYNYLKLMMYQGNANSVIDKGWFYKFLGPGGSRVTHNTNGKNRLVTNEYGTVLSRYFFSTTTSSTP